VQRARQGRHARQHASFERCPGGSGHPGGECGTGEFLIGQGTGEFYWALNMMGIVCLIGALSYSVLLGRLYRIEID
jgi:hypothetical protein